MANYSTVGVTKEAANMLDFLQKELGGQKRDLASELLIGLMTSDKAIFDKVLAQGKLARLGLETGVNVEPFTGVTFPSDHPLAGSHVSLTVEKITANGKSK